MYAQTLYSHSCPRDPRLACEIPSCDGCAPPPEREICIARDCYPALCDLQDRLPEDIQSTVSPWSHGTGTEDAVEAPSFGESAYLYVGEADAERALAWLRAGAEGK